MPKIGLSRLAPALRWPKYFYQGLNRQYFRKGLSYRPIAYWPMWEASGSVAYDISGNGNHGAYTGVTLGQTGIGDGRTCPLFDGANDYNDIYSTGFRDLLDPEEGTALIWVKVANAAVWEDDTARRPLEFFYWDGAANEIYLSRTATDDQIQAAYFVNPNWDSATYAPLSLTSWMCWCVTWTQTGGTGVTLFVNGSQVAQDATIPAWPGAAVLSSAGTCIGAGSTTPTAPWNGWLAHGMVFDSVLEDHKILDLSVR